MCSNVYLSVCSDATAEPALFLMYFTIGEKKRFCSVQVCGRNWDMSSLVWGSHLVSMHMQLSSPL